MKNLITFVLALTCAAVFGQTAPSNPTPPAVKQESKLDTVPAFLQLSEFPSNSPSPTPQPAFTFVVNGYIVVETTYAKVSNQPFTSDIMVLNANKAILEPKYLIWNYKKHE